MIRALGPGAMRLSAELTVLAGVIRVAPAQALARAHALLARGSWRMTSSAGSGTARRSARGCRGSASC